MRPVQEGRCPGFYIPMTVKRPRLSDHTYLVQSAYNAASAMTMPSQRDYIAGGVEQAMMCNTELESSLRQGLEERFQAKVAAGYASRLGDVEREVLVACGLMKDDGMLEGGYKSMEEDYGKDYAGLVRQHQ